MLSKKLSVAERWHLLHIKEMLAEKLLSESNLYTRSFTEVNSTLNAVQLISIIFISKCSQYIRENDINAEKISTATILRKSTIRAIFFT